MKNGGPSMKISDIHQDPNLIQYLQQNGKVGPAERNSATPAAQNQVPTEDKVDLSSQSKEMKKIADALAATPDVRAEKVEALKKQVESGQYQVNSDSVAEKMLKEFLFDMNR
jgi:negative regulator of flagellin synthesis FlgM